MHSIIISLLVLSPSNCKPVNEPISTEIDGQLQAFTNVNLVRMTSDTEILVEAVAFDFRIEEIPVQTRYFKEASSVNLAVSLRYGVKTLFTVLKYVLHRSGVIKCKLFIP